MIDEEFVAAIVADPDDRATRAVYADWLEQRGDRRAELVRLESELWREPLDLVRFRSVLVRRNELRAGCDPHWVARIARPSLTEIRRRVGHLATLDPECRAESASHHRYRLNPPLDEAQIAAVEHRIGCRLPEQYRRFVGEVADGGCGPAYGIASIAELDGDRSAPFEPPTTVGRMKRTDFTGAFEVCEVGCGIFYYLIVSGSDAGVVWYCGDGTVVPAPANGSWSSAASLLGLPRSARAEFIDWYVQWLDEALWAIARARPDGDDVFDRPPDQVIHVNLAARNLTEVPAGLRRLKLAERIDLQDNPLERLPNWIGEFERLRWLTLTRSALRELPEQLGDLRALRHLSCFQSKSLEQIPHSIGRLTALDDLDLRYCALGELPSSIGELAQLRELQIHNNPLTTLPASVGKLHKLRKLDLSFCRIQSLPDEISELPELTEINLRANQLVKLPAAIARCRRLVKLWLTENPKLDLVDAFGILRRIPTLRQLSLSSMNLTTLPDEIGELTQLEYLSLAWNRLTSLPPSIAQLTNLREIDLQGSGNSAIDTQALYDLLPKLGASDDDSDLIADVTIPDGTRVIVGVPFVKIWRLRNTGRTSWTEDFRLVHVDGPDFGATSTSIAAAAPGEEIDVSLVMTANEVGVHRSTWQLANDDEQPFGVEFFVEVDAYRV